MFRRHQTALGQNGISQLLAFGDRRASGLPRGIHGVLRLNGANNLRNCDPQLCQFVGVHPHSHRVLARAEHLDIADAGRPKDRINEIDVGVIPQKSRVIGSVRRVNSDQHEGSRHRFSYRDSVIVHLCRKLGGSLRFTRLGEDEVVIWIGFCIEIHDQARGRVCRGVQGVHVIHVVHTVHLLFERRGHCLFQSLRVGADVGGEDLDFGWSDFGELGNRQSKDGQSADQH